MGMPPNRGIHDSHLPTRFLRFGLVLFVLLALVHPAIAQDGSASLQGVVEDISGARIAGAKITVSDPARGFRAEAVADAQGQFTSDAVSRPL